MPAQERADFNFYWNESMLDEGGLTKNPGGDQNNNGVDYYNALIPWCKGNSISVDQNTLKEPRDLISMLVTKYKNALYLASNYRLEYGKQERLDYKAGVNLIDIEKKFGYGLNIKRSKIGDVHKKYFHLEKILQKLFLDGHIALLKSDNEDRTLLHPKSDILMRKIRADEASNIIAEKRSQLYIINELHSGKLEDPKKPKAHVRLSPRKGWEIYIRDRFGAPSNFEGLVAGSMSSEGQRAEPKTIPFDLHIVFAECIARSFSGRGERGTNQAKIMRKITDLAIDSRADSINLNDYYTIFSEYGAPHMADYRLQRSIGDHNSAKWKLLEVDGSNPKSWKVVIDPDLLRWRDRSRDRERERE